MTAAGRPSSALLTSGALRNGIHGVTARSICPISPDRLRSKVEFAADEHVLSKAGLDYTLLGRRTIMPAIVDPSSITHTAPSETRAQ